jgi:hypothetical protein
MTDGLSERVLKSAPVGAPQCHYTISMARSNLVTGLQQRMRVVLALCTLSLGLSTAATGQEHYVQRGLFYSNTPYGALGWVDNVASFTAARRKQLVYDLSSPGCHSLPIQTQYWFLINNHGSNSTGPTSYIAVRAVGRSNAPGIPSNGVILYRNKGWLTASGTGLAELGGWNRIGIKDFVEFHDDAAAAGKSPDERLQELNASLGTMFHALASPDLPSSWEHRRIFGSETHVDEPQGDALFYWASLTQFPTVDPGPLIFYLNGLGASTIWIDIDGSDVQFPIAETEIRIGRPCNGAAAASAAKPKSTR